MKSEISQLMTLCDRFSIPTDGSFEQNILKFSDIFTETAKYLNLTAIKEPHDIMIKHYFDSIYPLSLGIIKNGDKIIDIGCGGGFPSMPLKLADRSLEFTLLDSLKKRLTFLDGAIGELELSGISTLHARAEEAGRGKNMRDSYDVAVSRAVASLPLLSELCLPFVKVGGYFLAYKGSDTAEIEEARAHIKELSGEIEDIHSYELPENAGTRTLVIIKKIKPTHPVYPRTSKALSKAFGK